MEPGSHHKPNKSSLAKIALSDVDEADTASKLITTGFVSTAKVALSDVNEADTASKVALSNFR